MQMIFLVLFMFLFHRAFFFLFFWHKKIYIYENQNCSLEVQVLSAECRASFRLAVPEVFMELFFISHPVVVTLCRLFLIASC